MKSLHKQRGLGYIGWLFTIAAISVAVVLVVRIAPPYAQHITIVEIIESIQDEPNVSRMTKKEIRTKISRRFDVNMVTGVSVRDLKINKKGERITVDLYYQIKEPIFKNIEVLITFSDQIELTP